MQSFWPCFRDKFHEWDSSEKVCAYYKTCEIDAKSWAMGHAWETLLGSPCFDVCSVFAFFLFPVFFFVWVGNNCKNLQSFGTVAATQLQTACHGEVTAAGEPEKKRRRGWTERKPREIAWGELRGEGGGWKRRQGKPWEIAWGESSVGKERYGSDDKVDGRKPREIAWGELCWEGAIRKRREGGRRGNRGK